MEFLKEFFKKVDFEKKQQTTKKHAKLPSSKELKSLAQDPDNDSTLGIIFNFSKPNQILWELVPTSSHNIRFEAEIFILTLYNSVLTLSKSSRTHSLWVI